VQRHDVGLLQQALLADVLDAQRDRSGILADVMRQHAAAKALPAQARRPA